jgi:pyruvate formate lyase activating enzyme
MKEAMLYDKLPENRVHCQLCAHRCRIADGKLGICSVRENRGGTLYTLVYGPLIAQNVDPIEKKPLYHFYPGSTAYSIAAPGCNFRCQWCQNAGIACAYSASAKSGREHVVAGPYVEPHTVVESAQRLGCSSIAYTYTEPTIFFEYAHDTARLARQAGLANVFVTNGYMTEEMLDQSSDYLDAANVDLKAFRDEVYRKYIGARLQPVLDSMIKMKDLGIWLEVTTLVVPGVNDDPAELRDAARFVAQELGVDTPWHLSRFFPTYKLTDAPPTPVATLKKAKEMGQEEGLRYVYVGNVPDRPGMGGNSTFCHHCDRLLVRRNGYRILENHVQPGNRCPDCETRVAGVGMEC